MVSFSQIKTPLNCVKMEPDTYLPSPLLETGTTAYSYFISLCAKLSRHTISYGLFGETTAESRVHQLKSPYLRRFNLSDVIPSPSGSTDAVLICTYPSSHLFFNSMGMGTSGESYLTEKLSGSVEISVPYTVTPCATIL